MLDHLHHAIYSLLCSVNKLSKYHTYENTVPPFLPIDPAEFVKSTQLTPFLFVQGFSQCVSLSFYLSVCPGIYLYLSSRSLFEQRPRNANTQHISISFVYRFHFIIWIMFPLPYFSPDFLCLFLFPAIFLIFPPFFYFIVSRIFFSSRVADRPAVWGCRGCPSGWTCRQYPCLSPHPDKSILCLLPQRRLLHRHF